MSVLPRFTSEQVSRISDPPVASNGSHDPLAAKYVTFARENRNESQTALRSEAQSPTAALPR
ncbi:MAG TPA: hypothetical protein VNE63_05575, partial [Candidatus Acidoferrales bacterium]|nr:hypothetical protein [Candidatus Acidoferrales bacterium]